MPVFQPLAASSRFQFQPLARANSEWRNQNLLDYSTISKRIWKKWSIPDPVISIGWLVFPNEKERHGQLETPD
ncbi:hypothetical protein L6654_29360 [Bradyrhizobium sp. WYCCWR 13023]|uniref:Uncharacterized protein n=1 Tax=Bradyrhizobium zhengyangense TaxID=2911009 RepID=A0A9X1UD79_9BRAD|nr:MULTISPECIES: hypothetical protein [Bradyrhizobium]MCG2630748.1 hypothetical protein [Bradyrhizobium zhengyangense]MCG2671640.1 hypothetical protein [Bradyrhizobium zhengyangense]